MGVHSETGQWAELTIWGGKIVENIAQATARDCLAIALHKLKHLGILVHVHDEIIAESIVSVLDEMLEVMGEPIDWAPGLRLTAVGFNSQFYKKD